MDPMYIGFNVIIEHTMIIQLVGFNMFQYEWEIFRIQQMEVRKRTIYVWPYFAGDIPWNLGLKNKPYIYIYI